MEINLSQVPLLSDNQEFYEDAYMKHIKDAASKFIGTLYLLAKEGNKVAFEIFKQTKDVESTTNLFYKYKELNALSQSLHFAYANSDETRVAYCLQGIYFLLTSCSGGYSLGSKPIEKVVLGYGDYIHIPTNALTARVIENNVSLGKVASYLVQNGTLEKYSYIEIIKDSYTIAGTRVSVVTNQPIKVGYEFDFLGTGNIPNQESVELVQKALNTFSRIDYGLAASANKLFNVVSVAAIKPGIRQAGSLSSVPGWAWQDVDLEADSALEFCHLVSQLIHEFFHTKLYLIEKNIALYQGDGNIPEVFSPWKNRKRPIRQVIHALATFSASAKTWTQLIEIPWLPQNHLLPTAEAFWKENLEFAFQAQNNLLASNGLTEKGILYINAIVDDLKKSVEKYMK